MSPQGVPQVMEHDGAIAPIIFQRMAQHIIAHVNRTHVARRLRSLAGYTTM
jgi:hypothetical protein